jgi:opacity protein-like surface antigen
MKKLLLLGTILSVVLSAAAFGAVSASANSGNGAGTAFKATYVYNGITFTCSGSHVVNTQHTQDSETCLLSGDVGLYPIGTTTYGPGYWLSDFSGPGWPYQTIIDQTVTFTYSANGDGTYTLGVLAIY